MKKIPTMFQRRPVQRHVTDTVTSGCEWVLVGEGVATRKWDGSCCMVRGNKLYKRRELSGGQEAPPLFEQVGIDSATGKRVGWVPVGDSPEDRWHREAFMRAADWPDGTYELVGPKVNGDNDGVGGHKLIPHGTVKHPIEDRSIHGIRRALESMPWEGFVFWHPDGRRAKIKRKDFNLPWPVAQEVKP